MEVVGRWATVDKAGWGDGPWTTEPDKQHWVDPETDYDCLIHRGPMGALCGYVGVTEGHPAFGLDYEAVHGLFPSPEGWSALDVHGGLTYADLCQEGDDPATGICHVPLPGRPHKVWWLGFDCAHYMDYAPAYEARKRAKGYATIGDPQYRDIAYVEREVASLARQLRTLQP